jgi:hypothetical protein
MVDENSRASNHSRRRRWAGYALGIIIECAAVAAISLAALLVMLIIKAILA